MLKIDTSTDGTFYATGNSFFVVLQAGTVDGVSVVGTVIHRFRLGEVPADTVKISGDSGAADNLEAACDGNTYNVGGGAVVAASVTAAVALAASQPNYAPAKAGDKMDIVDSPSSAGKLALVDAFLTRAFGSVTYTGTTRCVLTALQKLRNKVANSGSTQTVYKEDDSTASYTSTLVADANADPITSVDPDA